MTNKSLKELLDDEYWAIRSVDRASNHVQLMQDRINQVYMEYETTKNQYDYLTNPRYQEYVDQTFLKDNAYYGSEYVRAWEECDAKASELKAIRKELKEYFAMIMAIDEEEEL